MKCLAPLAAVALLAGCDLMQPEAPVTEVWTGIAVPEGLATADAASTDTTKVVVRYERNALVDNVLNVAATLTIWETDTEPCDIPWLATDDPCFYMTAGEGVGVPRYSPDGRVIRFEMPSYRCELAGPISDGDFPDPDEWIAFLRCGDTGTIHYTMTLREG
ncbi:MAG: hypothetical protein OXU32_05385 [Gammaproteobacteria bacterium]|nr:hypothetical protein [Gammaproteobacteria bacterium]